MYCIPETQEEDIKPEQDIYPTNDMVAMKGSTDVVSDMGAQPKMEAIPSGSGVKVEPKDTLHMESFDDPNEESLQSQDLFAVEPVSLEVDSAREDQLEDVQKTTPMEAMLMKQVQELTRDLNKMKSMMAKKKNIEVKTSMATKLKMKVMQLRRPKVILKTKPTKPIFVKSKSGKKPTKLQPTPPPEPEIKTPESLEGEPEAMPAKEKEPENNSEAEVTSSGAADAQPEEMPAKEKEPENNSEPEMTSFGGADNQPEESTQNQKEGEADSEKVSFSKALQLVGNSKTEKEDPGSQVVIQNEGHVDDGEATALQPHNTAIEKQDEEDDLTESQPFIEETQEHGIGMSRNDAESTTPSKPQSDNARNTYEEEEQEEQLLLDGNQDKESKTAGAVSDNDILGTDESLLEVDESEAVKLLLGPTQQMSIHDGNSSSGASRFYPEGEADYQDGGEHFSDGNYDNDGGGKFYPDEEENPDDEVFDDTPKEGNVVEAQPTLPTFKSAFVELKLVDKLQTQEVSAAESVRMSTHIQPPGTNVNMQHMMASRLPVDSTSSQQSKDDFPAVAPTENVKTAASASMLSRVPSSQRSKDQPVPPMQNVKTGASATMLSRAPTVDLSNNPHIESVMEARLSCQKIVHSQKPNIGGGPSATSGILKAKDPNVRRELATAPTKSVQTQAEVTMPTPPEEEYEDDPLDIEGDPFFSGVHIYLCYHIVVHTNCALFLAMLP